MERGPAVGQPQTEPAPGEVRLWVSNQSFDDDPIRLTISIDGHPVVDDDFAVEGQHNWIPFDIGGLAPGQHTLQAESGTGVVATAELTVVDGEPRWLVVDYWYYADDTEGRHITIDEFDHAVAFA